MTNDNDDLNALNLTDYELHVVRVMMVCVDPSSTITHTSSGTSSHGMIKTLDDYDDTEAHEERDYMMTKRGHEIGRRLWDAGMV